MGKSSFRSETKWGGTGVFHIDRQSRSLRICVMVQSMFSGNGTGSNFGPCRVILPHVILVVKPAPR